MSPFKINDQDGEQLSKDYITAQLIERQEFESLKYNEWSKENNQSTKQFEKPKYRSKFSKI